MIHTKISCDRCKAPVTQGRTQFIVETFDPNLGRPNFDLCERCLIEFFGFLNALEVKSTDAAVEPLTAQPA